MFASVKAEDKTSLEVDVHRPEVSRDGGALTVGSPFFSLIMFSPAAWQGLISKAFRLVSSWPHCACSPCICRSQRRAAHSNQTNALASPFTRVRGWLVRSARPRCALAKLPDVMRAGVSNASWFGKNVALVRDRQAAIIIIIIII